MLRCHSCGRHLAGLPADHPAQCWIRHAQRRGEPVNLNGSCKQDPRQPAGVIAVDPGVHAAAFVAMVDANGERFNVVHLFELPPAA